MLALSTWFAIKDAVSAVGNHEIEPEFSLPATNEVIVLSIEKLKANVSLKANQAVEIPHGVK
jgi:xanthine dehydrogenase molybdopterin-binding subunit B